MIQGSQRSKKPSCVRSGEGGSHRDLAGAAGRFKNHLRVLKKQQPEEELQSGRAAGLEPITPPIYLSPWGIDFGGCGGLQSPKSNTIAFEADLV